MINSCLRPEISRDFAAKVIDTMTQEQRDKYGINDDNRNEAILALSAYAGSFINAAPTEDQQQRMLDNPSGFISFLDAYGDKKTILSDEYDETKEQYDSLIDAGFSRVGTIYVDANDAEKVEDYKSQFADMNSMGLAFVYQDTYTDDDGNNYVGFSYFITEPVKSTENAQENTVNQISKIRDIKHSEFPVRYEIAEDSDRNNNNTKWVNSTSDIPQGWHRTGNTEYEYKDQTIRTSSVTGYSNADFPLLSGPIGNQVDKVGRLTLGGSSALFQHDNEGKLVFKDDEELQNVINTQLGGIFTVRGLKNLVNDFLELKEQIKNAWGKNSVFITDEITLFAKTNEKDKEGNDLWKVGKPDLIVVGDNGVAHVLDFKTMKMRDIKSYNSIYPNKAEKYSLQESSYIRMLQSQGVNTDENAYIVQVDAYYDSSDYGIEKNEHHDDRHSVYYYQKADKKTGTPEIMGILDADGNLSQTLGEYAEQEGIVMDAEGRRFVLNPDSENEEELRRSSNILYLEPRLRVKYNEDIGFSNELAAIRGGENDKGSGIVFKDDISFAWQFDTLSSEEKSAVKDLFGSPVGRNVSQGIIRLSEDNIYSNPELVTPQEIANVGKFIAYCVSDYITLLSKGHTMQSIPLSKADNAEGEPLHTPLMGLSRKEIVQMVGVDALINRAFEVIEGHYEEDIPVLTEEEFEEDKEGWYKEEWETYEDYKKNKNKSDKAAWMITPAHREQLISITNAKLRALEDYFVPVKNVTTPDGLEDEYPNLRPDADTDAIEEDTGDNETNEAYVDALLDGTTDILAWMVGQRNYSPRASLAKEVRRRFESLYMLDDNGKHVLDPYGWGFPMHVDPTMAIQTIFDICDNCETVQEMKDALDLAVEQPGNRWIQQVIDTFNSDDNFLKKFYSQFRKDRLIYTISEVKFDKKTGRRTVITRTVNLKGAEQTMRDSLGAEFRNQQVGSFRINGKTYSVVAEQDGKNRLVYYDPDHSVAQVIVNYADRLIREVESIYKGANKGVNYTQEEYHKVTAVIPRNEKLKYINAELRKELPSLGGKSVIDGLTECLNGIGIMVPKEVVGNACKVIAIGINNSNAKSLLERVKEVCGALKFQDEKKEGIPSGLTGLNAFNVYPGIIATLSSHVQEYVESNVYQDGKTYYSFTNPSKLDHNIRNLQDAIQDDNKFKQYIHDNYGRYTGWYKDRKGKWLCDWVGQFAENSAAREALRHHVELSYIGTQYKELGALGFQLSILHNYFGTRDDQVAHPSYRYFALPTMSNKPVNEFIRMIKYGNERNYKREIINRVLMNTFKQEVNRIADVLYHYANNDTAVENMDITDKIMENAGWKNEIEAFKQRINISSVTAQDIVRLGSMNGKLSTGAKFHFLWYLNNELANNPELAERVTAMINELLTFQDDKNDADTSSDSADTLAMVMEAIRNNMEKIADAELQHMKDLGLFEIEERNINGKKVQVLKYQEEFGKSLGWFNPADSHYNINGQTRIMEDKLKEFIWQDIAANINIIQITGGDLAYYGNAINYQKRIAQIHSPGIHFMSEKDDPNGHDDGYLRSVHIADAHVREEIKYNTEVALNSYLDNNRTSMNPASIEEYKKMITLVVGGIKDALATDGQSFSSPTSIRKKLALQGDWDDAHEEAYKKICQGDLNINNLGIMMQPLKPFVTSDMAKYSGSPTMDIRRVPLQDKNSEYLIILSDALNRSIGEGKGKEKRNKFAAISDFMEMTAHELDSNGKPDYTKPNRHGIDTVHFASVCKVGASGVIDINEFDKAFEEEERQRIADGENKDDIEAEYNSRLTQFLYNSVQRPDPDSVSDPQERKRLLDEDDYVRYEDDYDYYNSFKKLKEEEVLYNTKYVDTIAVEDYIIQQEVPIHDFEEGALFGSQIRILGISDITPGTMFKVNNALTGKKDESMVAEDLIKEYKELHAENIKASFNSVMHELGFDLLKSVDSRHNISFTNLMDLPVDNPERIKVLQNLEYLLQKELSKDDKYGPDTRMACSLNSDKSDFMVPLMDPIQSKRIQMLLNSIIKKTINKQKITGGSAVQVTAYDRDLHIRFQDSDGKELLTLQEFQEEGKGSVDDFKKYLKEKQAGIKYFECYMPVPNANLEKLLINENGSMMTVKEAQKKLGDKVWDSISQIIGYRIPTEDKYSMLPLKIKGFMPKAAGQVIMMPQEITFLTGSDFDIDKMYLMMKAFNFSIDSSEKGIKTLTEEFLDSNKSDYYKGIEDDIDQIVVNAQDIVNGSDISWTEHVDTSENADKINAFVTWFKDYLLRNAFREYNNTKDKNSYKAKRARDNRILDLQWAVLTNKDTTPKMLNPGNFNEEKKIGRIIRISKAGIINPVTTKQWTMRELKSKTVGELDEILANYSDPHNTTLPSSKIYFQNQNMQGTQMTGIFANNNVSHAFCSFQKIGIDLNKGTNKTFCIDGEVIGNTNNVNNITVLDRQKGFNGQYISKTLASLLAASVDTAKDPVHKDLNISTFTGNVAATLARLGFDVETIGLILAQPVLVDLADLYFRKSNDGYYAAETAISEFKASLNISDNDWKELSPIRDNETFTKEKLFSALSDNNYKDNKEALDFQKNVLKLFNVLYGMSKDIQDLTFCTKFNSVTNAGGPTIADSMQDIDRVIKFTSDDNVEKSCFYEPKDSDTYSSVKNVISSDPILKAFYGYTIGRGGASEIIFKSFFPHYYDGFQNVVSYFKENYMGSKKLTSKLYNQLLDDYLYYLLTYGNENFNPVLPASQDNHKEQDYLVKGLAARFLQVSNIENRKPNILLDRKFGTNCIRVRKADMFIGIDTLMFSSSHLNSDSQEQIKNAWSELITMNDPNLSSDENTMIRRFGVDLFFYTLMRNGFGFSPKTLMHLASVIVRYNAKYKQGYDNYIDGIRNIKERDTFLMSQEIDSTGNIENFINQFVRNHSNNRQIVPNINKQDANIDTTLSSKDGSKIVFKVPVKEKYKLSNVMLNDNPRKFITITRVNENKKLVRDLYLLKRDDSGKESFEFVYEKTSALGLVNNFIEYDANDNLKESYFANLREDSDDSLDDEETIRDYGSDDRKADLGDSDTNNLWSTAEESVASALNNRHKNDPNTREAMFEAIKNATEQSPEMRQMVQRFIQGKAVDKYNTLNEMEQFITDQNPCK